MLRVALLIILLIASNSAFANTQKRKPVDVFYFPHIHAKFGGTNYENRGGDMVFFSYLHTALEILKDPGKYEVYGEGFYYNLNRRARYRIRNSEFRKFRRIFPRGFPLDANDWTYTQKATFVEYGPVISLYLLKRINIIRKTERWTNQKKMARHLKRCSETPFFQNLLDVSFRNVFSSWDDFYSKIRHTETKASRKQCYQIFDKREKYLIRKIKRRRKVARKPLLIIFGYAHDFGKYFNDDVKYIGSPELTYAALCFHYRHNPPNKSVASMCYYNYEKWLQKLGHRHYFNERQTFGHTGGPSGILGELYEKLKPFYKPQAPKEKPDWDKINENLEKLRLYR